MFAKKQGILLDSNNYAAGVARAYSGGGYSDWYLPSFDELQKLYTNKGAIGGFVDYYYWTSTETSATMVYERRFGAGASAQTTKDQLFRVRAIRKF